MDIARLIAHCRSHGIEFSLGNGTVKIRGTARIVEEILPVLRAHKEEIITYLSIEMIHTYDIPNTHHEAELALVETQALLNRVMARRI